MEKKAITNLKLNTIIENRWSPRSFSDKAVEKEKIQQFFEAARWAPSAYNDQPWRFIVGIKGDETWQKIFDSLVEFNQMWAVNAPVLVVAVGAELREVNGEKNGTWQYDVGQAMAYLTIQAYDDGLVMHQMGGFDPAKVVESFNLPKNYIPLSVSALGYQDVSEKLPAPLNKMEKGERSRKPLSELVFSGVFGNTSESV
jgi:nitroreductase